MFLRDSSDLLWLKTSYSLDPNPGIPFAVTPRDLMMKKISLGSQSRPPEGGHQTKFRARQEVRRKT